MTMVKGFYILGIASPQEMPVNNHRTDAEAPNMLEKCNVGY